jgi:DNA helicase-2/ATP-dependent DNA helicase PcrA
MNFLSGLNKNQLAAAQWDTGAMLILAGPGSGKTKTLISRVARIVHDTTEESFRILCLTFTRKAAAEMRERLHSLIPEAKTRTLLTTFHSFATDILRQHGSHFGLTPDFEIIEDAERVKVVKSIIESDRDAYSRLLSAEKALAALDYLFQNLKTDDEIQGLVQDKEIGEQFQRLFKDYKDYLKKENCLDYAAIIYFSTQLLRERSRISKQLQNVYRYVCVDEFQDTNIAQYLLLRELCPEKKSNVFIVGDDDQVIYQWNGASPSRIKELAQHYDLQIIQLPENYRCPPSVVSLANCLIGYNQERSGNKKPLLPMKSDEADQNSVRLFSFDDADKEAEGVTADIQMKLSSGIKPSEIVILARNSKLLERLERQLTSSSIPVHVQKRKTQFESAPLRFITGALKLATVRTDEEIVATVTKALSDCIDNEIDTSDVLAFAGQVSNDHLQCLGLLSDSSNDIPADIKSAIKKLVAGDYQGFTTESFGYFDSIEAQSEQGTEQYADFPSERKVWKGIIEEIGGEDEAYALSVAQFLQELALANKTPDAPSNSIRCLTIHASKGMEFNHVYLIGMSEDNLPSFQSKKTGDHSREMQEERRNCFVAITRTIQTLTMTYAKQYNGWAKTPSRFLKEMGIIN